MAPSGSLGGDRLVESIVLTFLIGECPEGEPVFALALRFNEEFEQGSEGDAVERAIVELVRNRLLRIEGGRVVPY